MTTANCMLIKRAEAAVTVTLPKNMEKKITSLSIPSPNPNPKPDPNSNPSF